MLHFSPPRCDRLGFNNKDDTYAGGTAEESLTWQTTRLQMTERERFSHRGATEQQNPFRGLFGADCVVGTCRDSCWRTARGAGKWRAASKTMIPARGDLHPKGLPSPPAHQQTGSSGMSTEVILINENNFVICGLGEQARPGST